MIKNKPKYWTKKLEKKFDSLIVKCFSDKATDTEKEFEDYLSKHQLILVTLNAGQIN